MVGSSCLAVNSSYPRTLSNFHIYNQYLHFIPYPCMHEKTLSNPHKINSETALLYLNASDNPIWPFFYTKDMLWTPFFSWQIPATHQLWCTCIWFLTFWLLAMSGNGNKHFYQVIVLQNNFSGNNVIDFNYTEPQQCPLLTLTHK